MMRFTYYCNYDHYWQCNTDYRYAPDANHKYAMYPLPYVNCPEHDNLPLSEGYEYGNGRLAELEEISRDKSSRI